MATQPKLDELNNIESQLSGIDYRRILKEFFDGMEIGEDEKEKRLALANDLRTAILLFFGAVGLGVALAQADLALRIQSIARQYSGKNIAYLNDYANRWADKFASATRKHKDDTDTVTIEGVTLPDGQYWTSEMRATLAAEDIANAIANYEELIEAFESGKRYKTWISQKDKRVRHTHNTADNQKKLLWEPFSVGGYDMMMPLDDSLGAPDEEIANCRCVISFS